MTDRNSKLSQISKNTSSQKSDSTKEHCQISWCGVFFFFFPFSKSTSNKQEVRVLFSQFPLLQPQLQVRPPSRAMAFSPWLPQRAARRTRLVAVFLQPPSCTVGLKEEFWHNMAATGVTNMALGPEHLYPWWIVPTTRQRLEPDPQGPRQARRPGRTKPETEWHLNPSASNLRLSHTRKVENPRKLFLWPFRVDGCFRET